MQAEVVLVEREDRNDVNLYGSSGILINSKYVLITSNILDNLIHDESIKTFINAMKPGVLYCHNLFTSLTLNVINKKNSEDLFDFRKATIIATFASPYLEESCDNLKDFAVDFKQNHLTNILSIFLVLNVDNKGNVADLKTTLLRWFQAILKEDMCKGDEIYMACVPFANRIFLNSYSRGIISNTLGESGSLILADCHSTPGCEGSPVYSFKHSTSKEKMPLGIVISTLCWWRGEYIGITLIADLRALIMPLLDTGIIKTINSVQENNPKYKLLSTVEYCLAQVYCGSSAWGTAILVDSSRGIFITSAHLLEHDANIELNWKGMSEPSKCIYKTPKGSFIDIAVIQAKQLNNVLCQQMKPIVISKNIPKLCDTVYAAGYSLFPKDTNAGPTLSKGEVSSCSTTIVQTTCFVHAGSSGGAILNSNGKLLGVIVSNIKLEGVGVFPKSNMAVSTVAIFDIIMEYLDSNDENVLKKLHKARSSTEAPQWSLQAKL